MITARCPSNSMASSNVHRLRVGINRHVEAVEAHRALTESPVKDCLPKPSRPVWTFEIDETSEQRIHGTSVCCRFRFEAEAAVAPRRKSSFRRFIQSAPVCAIRGSRTRAGQQSYSVRSSVL